MSILSLNNIHAGYVADVAVFPSLSMTFSASKLHGISGPSGGGKSTLFHVLTGAMPEYFGYVKEGELRVLGQELMGLPMKDRAKMLSAVLQSPNAQIIFEKVQDELAFVLENRGLEEKEIYEKIHDYAQRMKLSLEAKTETLSGGEKQKLVIASALLMGHTLLLLDEPLAHLDEESAHEIMTLLRRITEEEGVTVLMIEHRIDFLKAYAHELYWVDHGTIQKGPWGNGDQLAIPERQKEQDGELLISLTGITKTFGKRVLYNNLDFHLRKGDHVVITGRNGTGKTTLLKILLGLEKITSGTIYRAYKKKVLLQKVGFVMQNPSYQLCMPTVQEELALGMKDLDTFHSVVKTFRLETLLGQHPQSLSEGEKRRVGVAAVLVRKPEILLLDEPSVGMDQKSLEAMMEAIFSLYEDTPLTMVTITHDQRLKGTFGRVFNLG